MITSICKQRKIFLSIEWKTQRWSLKLEELVIDFMEKAVWLLIKNLSKEFDTLVVEHHGLKWSIPRNKSIDRFIRKSKRVYNQIDKNQDKYLLLFMFEGREIYSIPFDDCEKMMNLSYDIIYWMFSKNSYFSDNYQLLELENSFVINSDDNYKFI